MQRDDQDRSTLPLKALPSDQLPREKLALQGRAALSDEELIAIFLRTGLQGCNVLELAALLKRRAGSLAALGALEASDIMELCKGIGPAKAATLAAVFELGHRAARESQQRVNMRGSHAVYEYFVDEMRFMSQEQMYVLLLNTRCELIRRVEISRGTLTRVVVHPRDVFREAIRYNANAIIITHNHPSGDPTPSSQDDAFTASINEAAKVMHIRLMDHVIIGAPAPDRDLPYYSYRDHGKLES